MKNYDRDAAIMRAEKALTDLWQREQAIWGYDPDNGKHRFPFVPGKAYWSVAARRAVDAALARPPRKVKGE